MTVKPAWLFESKMSGADEGPVISTDVRLALIYYAPISKNMEAHIVFDLLLFRSFCFLFFFFTGA